MLLFLLVFCAPFLMTARNADRASTRLSDRAQARIAVDAAARHARAVLQNSHVALDRTAYFDSESELKVDNSFPEAFLDVRDAQGVMWDVQAQDLAGVIDLNSASPQVIGNMMGLVARLSAVTEADATELSVSSTEGFEPKGFLWIEGEIIHYAALGPGQFLECTRGVGVKLDDDDALIPQGPLPAETWGIGTTVLDQRAVAAAHWRTSARDGQPHFMDAEEQVEEAETFAMSGSLGQDPMARMREQGSVHAGMRAGSPWQWPVRLRRPLEAHVSQAIVPENSRWFAAGSTVQIADKSGAEIFFVSRVTSSGSVFLDRPVSRNFDAWTTSLRVLARRPVNLNTATPAVLETLFANVQMAGVNARVTRAEARDLAAVVVASRPFEGHEDFLRRVLLPAAGIEILPGDAPVVPQVFEGAGKASIIDESDALALYANGLNANDRSLAFSTMPFGYTSRDVYRMDLRSSINAPSGVERVALAAERIELVVPQTELFSLWGRQEDFDESLRLTRQSAWWQSGPLSTTRFDGSEPPSRLNAHFGTRGGRPFIPGTSGANEQGGDSSTGSANTESIQHVFASREDDGWLQLAPARVAEHGNRLRRIEHFDHETRALEGRYLPDETLRYSTSDKIVNWTGPNSAQDALLRSLSFSAWIQPQGLTDSVLLDIGDTLEQLDRVSLRLEGGELVLRVLDAFGDHPDSDLKDHAELRYSLAPGGANPGMPAGTWNHIQIDVAGNRPDQMSMVVNGSTQGVRTPGLTRLTGALDTSSLSIPVESTEGFPNRGVLRIGDELIEYTQRSAGGFVAQHLTQGEGAGFGGRGARTRYQLDTMAQTLTEDPVPSQFYDETKSVPGFHPAGSAVTLYGYSQLLSEDLLDNGGTLSEDLGQFRIARVTGMLRGDSFYLGDPIAQGPLQEPSMALGFEAGGVTAVTGLILGDAESNSNDLSFLEGFSVSGGYVALVQMAWTADGQALSMRGSPLGGVEVIRYNRRVGPNLIGLTRGHQAGLINLSQPTAKVGGTRAYVTDWANYYSPTGGVQVDAETRHDARVFAVPVSMVVDKSVWNPSGPPTRSEFLQITETGNAERTEWIRFDEPVAEPGGQRIHLVRDSMEALQSVYDVIVGDGATQLFDRGSGRGGPPGDGGGIGGTDGLVGAGNDGGEERRSAPSPVVVAASTPAPQGGTGVVGAWQTELGPDPLVQYPLARAVSAALRFRGVMGTRSHPHAASTFYTSVFEIKDFGPDRGRMGRFDTVFLSREPQDLGLTYTVHRAHLPAERSPRYGWSWQNSQTVDGRVNKAVDDQAARGELVTKEYDIHGVMYVAMQDRSSPVPTTGRDKGPGLDPLPGDVRLLPRFTKFPSGERPRFPDKVTVGEAFNGAATSVTPSAVVDEIVFGTPQFGVEGTDYSLQGAQLILKARLGVNDTTLMVEMDRVRVPGGWVPSPLALAGLPEGGGMLRIGSEILSYESRDPAMGMIFLGASGRALLGTQPQPHEVGEPITWLESWTVATLTAAVTPSDSTFNLSDISDFPFEGTLRINDELIHYTRKRDGALEMPRASQEPGRGDELGDGLFRGRFGTQAGGHGIGSAVILFPFRYWDRWNDRADAPELACFGFELEQPAAWWKSVHWEAEPSTFGGAQLGVLQRTDASVPWDADPGLEDGLEVMWEGEQAGGMVPIGRQSDLIEWRVFARYNPGAFDPIGGFSHGWRETPRFRRIALSYMAPNQVVRSVRQ